MSAVILYIQKLNLTINGPIVHNTSCAGDLATGKSSPLVVAEVKILEKVTEWCCSLDSSPRHIHLERALADYTVQRGCPSGNALIACAVSSLFADSDVTAADSEKLPKVSIVTRNVEKKGRKSILRQDAENKQKDK